MIKHTMIPGLITSWSKSLLRCKSKPMVMDAAAADRTGLMKKKKDGPCYRTVCRKGLKA
jgi:hypothetical protein